MNRKKFIKTCGFSCLGALALSQTLTGCSPTKTITVGITGDEIIVPIAKFVSRGKPLEYITVHAAQLQFPIYLLRISNQEYTAVYLKCTHQGNAVNAFGHKLVCSAHGSEFDRYGQNTNGPATSPLRQFPVQVIDQDLHISLKRL